MRQYDCRIFRADSWRDSRFTQKLIREFLDETAAMGAALSDLHSHVAADGELVIFILVERDTAPTDYHYTEKGLEEIKRES